MTVNNDLVIIRGLPGAGKSTLAKLLSEGRKYPVFSVDDYFTDKVTGAYQFNHTENHLAYALCEQNTRNAMQQGVSRIFIDNVFSMDWEIEPYFKMAEQYHYRVFVITVENRHGNNNVHGITDEQLTKMAAKYQVYLKK